MRTIWIIGIAATLIALQVKSIYALWFLCSDFVYCLLFPALTCALFDSKANKYGAIAGLVVAAILRFGGGDATLGIPTFIEYIDDYDNGGQIEITHSNVDLAFSPNFITSLALSYEAFKNLNLTWTNKYVGDQYLDNTSNDARKISAYFVSNARIDYTIETKVVKDIKIGFAANNIFNQLYANNGYTYGWYAGGSYARENFLYPQAGINFLGRLTLNL